jgi:hypothetical protein
VQRSFCKNTALDTGKRMDLGLSRDMFDSFLKYQTTMQQTFRHPPGHLRLYDRGRQPLCRCY